MDVHSLEKLSSRARLWMDIEFWVRWDEKKVFARGEG